MKIYTKTGDSGSTSLLGGARVPKNHIRIETYGTVDELNSWVGVLRSEMSNVEHVEELLYIQDRLFTMGSHLALEPGKTKIVLPEIFEEDIVRLENAIDRINERIPPMRSFVLPGATPLEGKCHVARTVCRRAERLLVHLAEETELSPLLAKYLNRLSDYLFTLARGVVYEAGGEETPWVPKK